MSVKVNRTRVNKYVGLISEKSRESFDRDTWQMQTF